MIAAQEPKSTVIHELRRKIEEMTIACCEARLIRRSSVRAFAQYAGIPHSTLFGATATESLEDHIREKLSQAAAFDDMDVEWIDRSLSRIARGAPDSPEYPGLDTVKAFRSLIRKNLGLEGRLKVLMRSSQPRLFDENLLTFEVTADKQEVEFGNSLRLFFNIVASIGVDISGLQFSFTEVRLQIRPSSAESGLYTQSQLGKPDPIEISGATLTCVGAGKTASWYLRHPQGLENEYTSSEVFCEIGGVALGENVYASLSVNLHTPNALVIKCADKDISKAQEAILKVLIETLIKAEERDLGRGWFEFGRQRLMLVKP